MKLAKIYKQTKTGATQEWEIEVVGNKYRTIAGQTNGKKIISEWTVCYGKNAGKANATTDNQQARKEAEAKRKLKLEKDYHETVTTVSTKRHFEPMLAAKWQDRKDEVVYPIYSQPKLDGIRCIVKADGMWSRNGKRIVSAPHIMDALAPLFKQDKGLIFDGELYADKYANDFNSIVSLVKKTKPTEDDLKQSAKNIQYHIYDFPSCKTCKFSERYDALRELFRDNGTPKSCVLVKTVKVKDEEQLMERYEEYVEKGYEGQILRIDAEYENKRSKYLLKHKSFMDEEFKILDIVEGEGNKTGKVGYMVFERKGKRFKSNVKCNMVQGADILKRKKQLIGKQATVKYFNLTPDGVPRFPYVINIDRESYE